jgi:hypothetical protein
MKKAHRESADNVMLTALACGATVDLAAEQAGISRRTAANRLNDPVFKERLRNLKAEIVQRACDNLAAAAGEAVATLLELLPKGSPGVRLGAARSILEIGMKFREATDLETRLRELERRMGDVPLPELPPGSEVLPLPPAALDVVEGNGQGNGES